MFVVCRTNDRAWAYQHRNGEPFRCFSFLEHEFVLGKLCLSKAHTLLSSLEPRLSGELTKERLPEQRSYRFIPN